LKTIIIIINIIIIIINAVDFRDLFISSCENDGPAPRVAYIAAVAAPDSWNSAQHVTATTENRGQLEWIVSRGCSLRHVEL
jgi:hypothetical protein